MTTKRLIYLEEKISAARERLKAAKIDLANSVLSDNHGAQNEVSVIVKGRHYAITRINSRYLQEPRPGYEMMLLAAKKILAAFIDELENEIRKLELELVEAAKNIAEQTCSAPKN